MWAARKRASETGSENKAIVVVATEKRAHAIGRIRLRRIKDVSAESLLQFIRETIEPGATIHTDGWSGYAGLADAGYPHRVTVISASPEPAHEVMPRVHKVAALLKRWLLGTLQGGIQHQHLDYYLRIYNLHFASTASLTGSWPPVSSPRPTAVAVGPAPYHVITSGPQPQLG